MQTFKGRSIDYSILSTTDINFEQYPYLYDKSGNKGVT